MTTIKASLQIGHNRKSKIIGEISLNSTHLVFTPLDSSSSILSIPYSDLKSIHRKVPLILSLSDLEYPFHIFCKSLLFLRFHLHSISQADLFYSTIQKNMNIQNINQLACFSFSPQVPFDKDLGWSIYNFQLEYSRMGLDSHPTKWRISKINQDFSFSQSYPRQFIVPAKISDTVLRHIGNFRSKSRIPVLSYFHSKNFTSITRSSQPMVGLKQARSLQDEKLIETIFMQSLPEFPLLENSSNVILDARPTANAMGQMALGAGTENTDNYKHCKLVFAGIDNIHAVRDSQNKLIDVLLGVDGPIPKHLLDKSQWLKHLHNILDGTMQIVSNIHLNNANVLVHCRFLYIIK